MPPRPPVAPEAEPSPPELVTRFRPVVRSSSPSLLAVDGQGGRLLLRGPLRVRLGPGGEDAAAFAFRVPVVDAARCGGRWFFLSEEGEVAHSGDFLGPLTSVGTPLGEGARLRAFGDRLFLHPAEAELEEVDCRGEPARRRLGLRLIRDLHATPDRVTAGTHGGVYTRGRGEAAWTALDLGEEGAFRVTAAPQGAVVTTDRRIRLVGDDGGVRRLRRAPEAASTSAPPLPGVSAAERDRLRILEAPYLRRDVYQPLEGGAVYFNGAEDAEVGFVVEAGGSVHRLAVPPYTHPLDWGGIPHRQVGDQVLAFERDGGRPGLRAVLTLPPGVGAVRAAPYPFLIVSELAGASCAGACLWNAETGESLDLQVPETPFHDLRIAGGRLLDVAGSRWVHGAAGEAPAPLPAPFAEREALLLDAEGRVLFLDAEASALRRWDGATAYAVPLPEGVRRLRLAEGWIVVGGEDTDALWASTDGGAHFEPVPGPPSPLPLGGGELGRCLGQRCAFGDVEVLPRAFAGPRPPPPLPRPPSPGDAAGPVSRTLLRCTDEGPALPGEPGRDPTFRVDGGRARWRGRDARGVYDASAPIPRGRACVLVEPRREGALLLCGPDGRLGATPVELVRVGWGRPRILATDVALGNRPPALLRRDGSGGAVLGPHAGELDALVLAWTPRGRVRRRYARHPGGYRPGPTPGVLGGAPVTVFLDAARRAAEVVPLAVGLPTRHSVPAVLPVCTGPSPAEADRLLLALSRHDVESVEGGVATVTWAEVERTPSGDCVRRIRGSDLTRVRLEASPDGALVGVMPRSGELAPYRCAPAPSP
jgi:hypothetical protein